MNTKTIFHRDNTVTLWNCIEGRWMRKVGVVSADVLATLPASVRARIIRHLGN